SSQLPAQPAPALQPKAESDVLHSSVGNAAVAAAAAGDSPSTSENPFSLQVGYGNATIAGANTSVAKVSSGLVRSQALQKSYGNSAVARVVEAGAPSMLPPTESLADHFISSGETLSKIRPAISGTPAQSATQVRSDSPPSTPVDVTGIRSEQPAPA